MTHKITVEGRAVDRGIGRFLRWGVTVVLVLIPFHAVLTTWAASNFGYFDVIRIWKELVLFVFCLGGVYVLFTRPKLWRELRVSWLFLLMAAYLALTLILALAGFVSKTVSPAAVLYGFLINTRLFAFFIVVYVYIRSDGKTREAKLPDWRRLVLIPAAVVIAFGLLQYALPPDFLRHFGYGPDTIPAFQTVDNKPDFMRLQSTLRGPNPLGAYLAVILPLLLAAGIGARKKLPFIALGAAGLVVLYGTFSRSAWLATAGAAVLVLVLSIHNRAYRRWLVLAGAALIVVAAGSMYALRNNDTFQNIAFHTDENSRSSTSSNSDRANALENGWRDVLTHPLGYGVGSAGPASVRNTERPAKISENYFLQIAQETGWLGLALLAAIFVLVGKELYRRRAHPLAMGLCAAFIGLTVVNLLSHAWTDDTLAYVFWGLAAIALALPLKSAKIANKV